MDDKCIETWIKNPNMESTEGWLDLIYTHYENGDYWVHAGVRFDGCVHLRKAYNSPFVSALFMKTD